MSAVTNGSAALLTGELTADEEAIAERIEGALECCGWRGLSPAAAARAARCTTGQASRALAWLAGHQYATTGRRWNLNRFYTGRPA